LGHPKAYIATQGPKFSTVKDFWRMIWQEQVQTIVMATNFVESKKRKCAEYWPQRLNCIFECGEMGITLKSEENFEHYDRRTLEMNYRGEVRAVQHYHLKWNPDQLTPLYPDRVVPLVKQIRNIRENSTTPIVIHCSSGVNRTGTLILCDMALQMATEQNKIDFYKLTKDLRDQRPNMVSTEKQYLLAHLVVLECLMEEENVFRKIIRENFALKRYKAQLNYLDRLHWHDEEVQSWIPYQVATPFSGIPGWSQFR
jgi:protein tyrosine phosphatase